MEMLYNAFVSLLFCLLGYVMGNILFAEIITKIFKKNIREFSSGNPGATNVARVLGKTMGIITLLLDASKAYVAVIFCWAIFSGTVRTWEGESNFLYSLVYLGGLFAVVGHCFPIKYIVKLFTTKFDFKYCKKYSGGKGVSCTGGYAFAYSPFYAIILFIIWVSIILIFKFVSIASMCFGIIGAPIIFCKYINLLYLFGNGIYDHDLYFNWNSHMNVFMWFYASMFIQFLIIGIILIIRHKDNIKRLIKGNEITFKKIPKTADGKKKI